VGYQYDKTPLTGELSDYQWAVRLHKVDETKWEAFWDELVREHHYLGAAEKPANHWKYWTKRTTCGILNPEEPAKYSGFGGI